MAKIGVLGYPDSIAIYRALGLDTFCVRTEQEAHTAFRKMMNSEYAVIYLEEEWLPFLSSQVNVCAQQELPAVVLLPGREKETSTALTALEEAVKRAVGADIA